MEIASLVISILSIVISAIVAGIPFYRKYIEKKPDISKFVKGNHQGSFLTDLNQIDFKEIGSCFIVFFIIE
jgi:hypothetical protein